MDEIREQSEFYEIIPEFNSTGRLCNYGSGDNPIVKVPADEWERFNQLAGRRYEIIDGVVVFNPDLEPCLPDGVSLENPWTIKLTEIGLACSQAIYAGIQVNGKNYSLAEHDQIELLGQADAIKQGTEAVPYHADGELCRMFPADEFMAIAAAATVHIFYHRTYCNHLNVWIRRTEDIDELQAISYGAQLPDDLAANMAALLAAAGGSP